MTWYKDPLFGVVVLFVVVAVVGALDFIRNKLREKKRLDSIENLKKSYDYLGIKDGVEEFLNLSPNPLPTLEFIAQAYIQSGNIQEAIKIYASIANNLTNPQEKSRILYALGIAYFRAGFLQRAKNIFLEIIKNYPRNPEVLEFLLKTYENLGEYKAALDALSCIDEICTQDNDKKYLEQIYTNSLYLQALDVIADTNLSLRSKFNKLKDLQSKFPKLQKLALKFYKETNIAFFWQEVLQLENVENLIDIFWKFNKEEIPLNQLQNQKILDIYRAKGYLDSAPCSSFELESIRVLREFSDFKANLVFEYRCNECKNIFPFESNRCPKCNEPLSLEVISKVVEQKNEISYSLL